MLLPAGGIDDVATAPLQTHGGCGYVLAGVDSRFRLLRRDRALAAAQ
jgi:hypothetical protein